MDNANPNNALQFYVYEFMLGKGRNSLNEVDEFMFNNEFLMRLDEPH